MADRLLKLGSHLYVHPDEIAAISFEEDDCILVHLSGNECPFALESQEAKDDLMDWLKRQI